MAIQATELPKYKRAVDRSSFALQMQDRATLEAVAGRLRTEVGNQGYRAWIAWLETTFNRAMARGQSLVRAVTGAYFPTHSPGRSSNKDYIDAILRVFKEGTNITNGATGNASGSVGFAGGPQTYEAGGERFGIEGPDMGWWKNKFPSLLRDIGQVIGDVAKDVKKGLGWLAGKVWDGAKAVGEGVKAFGGELAKLAGKITDEGMAVLEFASKYKLNPWDIVSIMGRETGGSGSPNQWGGYGGKYLGLIQFSPENQRHYGVKPGMSFREQLFGPVARYLQDRFKAAGMPLEGATRVQLYASILAGSPKLVHARDVNGSATTAASSLDQHGERLAKKWGFPDIKNTGQTLVADLRAANGRAVASTETKAPSVVGNGQTKTPSWLTQRTAANAGADAPRPVAAPVKNPWGNTGGIKAAQATAPAPSPASPAKKWWERDASKQASAPAPVKPAA